MDRLPSTARGSLSIAGSGWEPGEAGPETPAGAFSANQGSSIGSRSRTSPGGAPGVEAGFGGAPAS